MINRVRISCPRDAETNKLETCDSPAQGRSLLETSEGPCLRRLVYMMEWGVLILLVKDRAEGQCDASVLV
jgi:hypothetical protein